MKKTNKIRYVQGILGAIVAALTLSCMILSCAQPEGAFLAGGTAGKGTVVITASTGSGAGSVQKTIVPSDDVPFTSYELVFSMGDITLETIEATPEQIAEGFEVPDLDAGTWKVTVTAYLEADGKAYGAASGYDDEVTVEAGKITPVDVIIKPLFGAGEGLTGTFTYQISFPAGVTGTISLKDGEGEEQLKDTELTVSITNDTPIKLAPGSYRLSISLGNGTDNTSAGLLEEVHIYAGLDSKEIFTFEDADFAPNVYLAGNIVLPDGVNIDTADIKVYSDTAYTTEVTAEVKASPAGLGRAWRLSIPANQLSDTLYFQWKIKSASPVKTYIVTGDTGAGLTDAGKPGIELEDTTLPTAVTGLKAAFGDFTAEDGTATLQWNALFPEDEDFDYIEVSWKSNDGSKEGTPEKIYNIKAITFDFGTTRFEKGPEYTFFVTTVDTSGNRSTAEEKESFPYDENMTAEALEDAIAKALETGGEINLGDVKVLDKIVLDLKTAPVKISGNFIVPANVTVKVGGPLTVDDNGILEVGSGGALVVADDVEMNIAGSVTAVNGSKITLPAQDGNGSVTFGKTGNIILTQGADVSYGKSGFISSGGNYAFNWAGTGSGTLAVSAGKVALSGSGAEIKAVNNPVVAAGTTLEIASGTTLTVDEEVTLTVAGELALANKLEGEGAVKTTGAGVVSVNNDVTLASALEKSGTGKITALKLLNDANIEDSVPAGLTLTVEKDKTLTVTDEIELGGLFAGDGTVKTDTDGVVIVKTRESLVSALAKSGTDGIAAMTLKDNVTLEAPATIPEGLTLTVSPDKMLDVVGVQLTLEGEFAGNGTVRTSEGAHVYLNKDEAGPLVSALAKSGTNKISAITLNESVELENAGTVPAGLTLTINGGNTLTAKAALTLEGEFAGTGTVNTDGGSIVVKDKPHLLWALGGKLGSGKILNLTFSGPDSGKAVTLGTEDSTLATIPTGVKFKVDTGNTLTLNNVALNLSGEFDGEGSVATTGANGSVIVSTTPALASALNRSGTNGIAQLKTGATTVVLSEKAELKAGATLTVADGTKLSIDGGIVFTVTGTINGAGTARTKDSSSVVVKNLDNLLWALAQSGKDESKIGALKLAPSATGTATPISLSTAATLNTGAELEVDTSVTLTITAPFTMGGTFKSTGGGAVATGTGGSVIVTSDDALKSVLANSGTGKITAVTVSGTRKLSDTTSLPADVTLTVANEGKLSLDAALNSTVISTTIVVGDTNKVTFKGASISGGTLEGSTGVVKIPDGKTITLVTAGTIEVAGTGSVDLANSKFGAGKYAALGAVTITANTGGDTIGVTGKASNGLLIGTTAGSELKLLTSSNDTATYTLKKDKAFVVFGNGTITVGSGSTVDTSSLSADGKTNITLGTGTNNAIKLGNGSKLVLAKGAKISGVTATVALTVGGALGGAVMSGESAAFTNSKGVLTVSSGTTATLTGAANGSSAISAGATITAATL